MPRLEFTDPKNFIKWLDSRNPEKYEIYKVGNVEVVVLPTVSTPPIKRAVYEGEIDSEIKKNIRRFDIYELDSIEWKSDSPLGSVRE